MKKSLLVPFLLVLGGCIADLSVDAPVPSTACEPEGLEPLLEAFPNCDLGICGPTEADRSRGRCVDDNQLGADQLEQLAPCANGYSHCVPTNLVVTDGLTQPTVCSSVGGGIGRCTSLCLPDIAAKADSLPRDICDEGYVCAPCTDPIDGTSTGACETNACDVAPKEPSYVFEQCCEGRARCIPTSSIPDDSESSLDRQTCTDPETLCVPLENTDPSYVAPSCTITRMVLGATTEVKGACVSTCVLVPDIVRPSMEPECPPDTQCVPCNILPGLETGACD